MRSEIRQPNRMLELWIVGEHVGDFNTFEELIEHIVHCYVPCA